MVESNLDIKEKIEEILSGEIGIQLFFALNNGKQTSLKRADLEDEETGINLKQQFTGLLTEEFIKSEEIRVVELSSADERNNAIYHYDLSEFPDNLKYFSDFQYIDNSPCFSVDEDDLSKVEALLIVIGTSNNYCVLYKRFYPIFLMGRQQFFLIKSKHRFKQIDDEIIRVNRDYNFIKLGEDVFIKDLKILEKFGGFKDIIEKEAKIAVESIKNLNILDDTKILSETLSLDLSFARKLGKIQSNSPVISQQISPELIIKFTKEYEPLKGKFKYNTAKNKIILTTKSSQKSFLELLDDSYLTSQLTKLNYNSLAKEQLL